MKYKIILIGLSLLAPVITFAHSAPESVIIHMKNSGFEPQDVTIEQGQTVIFESADEDDHWPASDAHPSHMVYPEFDPKKGIAPEESWEFRFDKMGAWKYHDHLNPTLRGTITVGEATEDDDEVLSRK